MSDKLIERPSATQNQFFVVYCDESKASGRPAVNPNEQF
jgi:hypothetical protein